jgi:DNA-directed RNA polymerase specialized sigma24 family protein
MSQREIAAYTGIPLGTIKTRLELGLRKLAEFLRGFEDLLSIEHSAAPAVVARSP